MKNKILAFILIYFQQLQSQTIGLLITAIFTLILVNTLQLESISTAGSVAFLLIFAIVNMAGFKLAKNTGSSKFIPIIGTLLCFFAMLALLIQQYSTSKLDVFIAIGIVTLSFIIEFIYKKTVLKNGYK